MPDEDRDASAQEAARPAPRFHSDSIAFALRGNRAVDRGQELGKPCVLLDDIKPWITFQASETSWGPDGPSGQKIRAVYHATKRWGMAG